MKLHRRYLASFGLLVISLAMLGSVSARADTPVIQLSTDDQQRLGIRFDSVEANSSAAGFRVPAIVIDSPERQSQITSFFSGTLTRWHLAGGETVAQGQVIATLSSAELMALQEQWLAAYNHFQDMQQQLQKDQQLLRDGVIAEQRLLQTRRNHRQAEFTLQSRRQQLFQAGIDDADLRALQAGELSPGDYRLRAPQTGLLNRRLFAVGDTLPANQVVATVTDASSLWLRAQLPLTLATLVTPGDRLQVADSGDTLTLISKNSALSPSTQRVEILARFDQPNALYPGQQIALVVPVNRQGYRIPAAAVTHSGNSTIVYVKGDQGIEAREVDLIPLGPDYLAVDRISQHEQLVVQGSAQLKGILLGLGGGE